MYPAVAFYYYYCAFWCDVAEKKALNVYFRVHYGALAVNSNE